MATGAAHIATKPLTVDGCTYAFVKTVSNLTVLPEIAQQGKSLHNLSYLYYTGFGALVTCIVAVLSSFLFGFRDPQTVDLALLAPFMRKYFDRLPVSQNESFEDQEDQTCAHEIDDLKLNTEKL